ncbi:MAG: penicillin-binding protein 2 [Anaerolineae bacterium]|jgi:penicillin-binding protein 2
MGIPRRRFIIFQIVAFVCLGMITARLWQLQVVSSQTYRASADANRFRLVSVDAPRGIIYDRTGRMLVRNVPSFTLSLVPAGLPEDEGARRAMMQRLADLLDMGPEGADELEQRLAARFVNQYAPVRVADEVSRPAAFIIEEEHLTLPGAVIEAVPVRQYVDGALTAHVLGYMGHIPNDQVEAYRQRGYDLGDLVGLVGLEYAQEETLAGSKGQKHIEVDAFEREVQVIASQPPGPGNNVVITLDLDLQQATENALREGMAAAGSRVGVAIAMDPRTGEVLAFVSLPNFDNNLFSGGISHDDLVRLSSDPALPLVNHGVSGQYPPGSVFKIVPATAALQEGVIDRRTALHCGGMLWLPNKLFPNDPAQATPFYCWRGAGHGNITVQEAITQSCDIFFYIAAGGYGQFHGLGIERLAQYAGAYGFGAPTGIELSGELAGLLPSDKWKRQNYGESWFTGDTYNAAIGQGFILATPLQVLNATAAIANGGTLYRPQLVYEVLDPEGHVLHTLQPEPIREIPVDDAYIQLVRQGMREAVTRGTAYLMRIPEVAVAGKTGSAEYAAFDEDGNLLVDEHGYLPTHAWFTAFAPYEDPEIALVVFLEGGGEGSQTAVPVASRILRHYFQLDRAVAPTPTPDVAAPAPEGEAAAEAVAPAAPEAVADTQQ